MEKYSFLDDYSEGCQANILEAMQSTNMAQQSAYGNDDYSNLARRLIRKHLDGDFPIYFVAGGTLANIIIMSSTLKSHEAVIAADSGHIVVRETGAIEATGHKIITVPSDDGKLTPESIEHTLADNAHFPHMAKPRLVYISNATETGTVYAKSELSALSVICKSNDLLLLLDGARLGAALTANISDLTLKDIAELTDIFWIGGTKAGALIGEAIVITNPKLAIEFDFHIKQRGALLAKGRLLGLQFTELFKDDLFFKNSRHANLMAQKLSAGLIKNGHRLIAETQSNQIFAIMPNDLLAKLNKRFSFYVWRKYNETDSVIRLVTSWATDENKVSEFIAAI